MTPLILSQTVSVSQATITGLPAQQLWWRVRGINAAGVAGPFSSARQFTLQAAPAPPTLAALSVSPTSVTGGGTSQGTVTLSAAPSANASITLSSSNTSVATVPASVTVAAGATSATFTVTTTSVTASTSATISTVFAGVTRTAVLTVTAAGGGGGTLPAPTLVSPAKDARFSPGQAITFDWSDVTGAASYTMQIDDADTFTAPLIVSQTVTASQYTNSTLPTRRLWWRVWANDAAGNAGAWSAVRRFEVK